MWNLIKMEFNTLQLKSYKKYILLIAIMPLILLKFLPRIGVERIYIILSYTFTYFISLYIMGSEKPESHYLINSLPINKSKVVLGKHVFIHLGLLLALVCLAIYLLVMKTLGIIITEKVDLNYIQTAIIIMIILVNICISLMNKTRLFLRVITQLIHGMGLWFITDFEILDILSKYKMNILLIAIASIGISLVLSMRLYNKREFGRR